MWGCGGVRGRHVAALLGLMALVPLGCAPVGPEGAQPPVVAMRTDAPVHEPAWSGSHEALLALAEGSPQIVKIDVAGGPGASMDARTTLSKPFAEGAQNLATDPVRSDVVFLPQPKLDRVAAVEIGDLRPVRAFRAGHSPAHVDVDSGSRSLLALTEDGSTVVVVDLYDKSVVASAHPKIGPSAVVHGAKRGRLIDVHVVGASGVVHYKGPPGAVEKKGELRLRVASSAGDLVKPSRLYVAESGTGRLLAVDSKRTLRGLEVVARTNLGDPVRHVGVDETRLYAATDRGLTVFETNSFEGYRNKTFSVIETINFRGPLPNALREAPVSGLAVGEDRVYLTLHGEPYVVSIAKPSI